MVAAVRAASVELVVTVELKEVGGRGVAGSKVVGTVVDTRAATVVPEALMAVAARV